MRIAIGGFLHESHSFAPQPTTYRDFVQPGGFPPLCYGPALIPALRDASVPAAGAIAVAEAEGATIVPLAWGFANPAGPVEDEAFERIAAMNCALLSMALDNGPLDGVYLDLHGAAMVDSFPDAEGELLRRVRAIVGPELPLTISLDPHANLTAAIVQLADDRATGFSPHVGQKEAGRRASSVAVRANSSRSAMAQNNAPVGFLDPARRPMHPDAADATGDVGTHAYWRPHRHYRSRFCFGFPYADFPDCGPALAVYADTQGAADEAADDLLKFINQHESEFTQELLLSWAAVAEARRLANTATGPIVIADTQDNPGGGGHAGDAPSCWRSW